MILRMPVPGFVSRRMTRRLVWAVPAVALLLLVAASVAADPDATANAAPPATMPQSVRALVAPAEADGATIGVALRGPDGSWLVGHRATEALIPASNEKLLTTATAVSVLGPDFTFDTLVAARGELQVAGDQRTRLAGDLVVIGGGDPTISKRFDPDDDPRGPFRRWARKLRDGLGLREITGDLVCDATLFDDEFIHDSWPRDQLLRWYEAPVAALSLEDNCFQLIVKPNGGGDATLATNPPTDAVRLAGTVDTAGRGNPLIHFSAADDDGDGLARVLTVRGRIPAASRPYVTDVTVENPVRYFGTVLLEVLREEGITVAGGLRIADEPVEREGLLALHTEQTSIERVLTVCNQRSQNGYAEHLFKRSGAMISDAPGSFGNGATAVTAFVTQHGVPADEVTVADGSGMSRGNRISPRALATVLHVMNRDGVDADDPEAAVARMFRESLAVAGRSGTLKRRLRSVAGRVIGKTGTLNGVDALSGYVLVTRDGREQRYPFVILANGVRGGHGVARSLLDRICAALVREASAQ